MSRPTFAAPDHIVVVAVRDPIEVWRISTATSRHDHTALAWDMTSNYERQQKPRKLEQTYSVVQMAVSMWLDEDDARALQRSFPKIGDHLARLVLEPDQGFCLDSPERGNHRSVWGSPIKLAAAVVDVVAA